MEEKKTPLRKAIESLKSGHVIGMPTDTVYGCGIAIAYSQSPSALNKVKGRAWDKPCALLIDSFDDMEKYAVGIPDYAYIFAKENWPGALTLILRASRELPVAFGGPGGTVALRMPECACARKIIKGVGCPIACSSANFTGEPHPQFFADVDPEFVEQLDYCVSCLHGQCKDASGKPSKIINCTGSEPVVVRE